MYPIKELITDFYDTAKEVNWYCETLRQTRNNEASKLFFECMQKEKATNTLATNSLI